MVPPPQQTSGAAVTRFAPSPTGGLHLGHAYAAWIATKRADAAGGRALLRIEDIDGPRCKPEFEDRIHEDMAWLGFVFDGAPLRQSGRLPAYAAALDDLAARGLVYRCFRTRKEVAAAALSAPHGPSAQNVFIGAPLPENEEAARLAAGEPFAWRLSLAAARAALGPDWDALSFEETGGHPHVPQGRIKARPERAGDVVLGRKDIGTSYHLACVIDDAAERVSLVTRGRDLFAETGVQALLQRLLGLPAPAYAHHALVVDAAGRRLAKRDGARELKALREEGVRPETILAAFKAGDLAPFGAALD